MRGAVAGFAAAGFVVAVRAAGSGFVAAVDPDADDAEATVGEDGAFAAGAAGAVPGPGCCAAGRGGSCRATYSCAARVPTRRNLTRRKSRATATRKRSTAKIPEAISEMIGAKPPPHPNPG
jgi:hypothetical protein